MKNILQGLRIKASGISEEYLKCKICEEILFDPVKCEGCKAIYCKECLSNKRCQSNGCTSNNIIKKKPGECWLNLYKKTILYCPCESSGCEFGININEILYHIENECKFSHLNTCLKYQVKLYRLEEEHKLDIMRIKKMYESMFAPMFDIGFGFENICFAGDRSKASYKSGSWPSVRIGILFEKEFEVNFYVMGRTWFGIGSENVLCSGFPGHTKEGWMVNTTDTGVYFNNTLIDSRFVSISNGQIITFRCDPVQSKFSVKAPNGEISYSAQIPKKVYFIVSLSSSSATLISVKY